MATRAPLKSRPVTKVSSRTRSKARSGERKARQANRSWTGAALARAGLIARGVVYLVLSYLAAAVTAGGGAASKNTSSRGSIEEIRHQPVGSVLVIVLALGLAAYGFWRLLQAAAGEEAEEHGKEFVKRFGWFGVAVVYFALTMTALEEAAGQSSRSNPAFSWSKVVLAIPGGQAALAVMGFSVVIAGVSLAAWAALQRFQRYLLIHEIPSWLEAVVHVIETFGNVVRGLVFAGIGVSFVAAAILDDPKDAKGLNGSLHAVMAHSYGEWLLAIAAAGFAAFGLASLFEARYRDIDANPETTSSHN